MKIQRFDEKDPAEKVYLTFNFAKDLPPGVLLTSVQAVTYAMFYGEDTNPNAMANGAPGLDSTSTKAIVPVQGGLDGRDYKVSARCATTDPNIVLELDGILPVRA